MITPSYVCSISFVRSNLIGLSCSILRFDVAIVVTWNKILILAFLAAFLLLAYVSQTPEDFSGPKAILKLNLLQVVAKFFLSRKPQESFSST